MPQQRSNKSQTPINSDAFNLTPDLATLADTLEVIVPVANQAEGDTVATARAAAGWPVTDARPLFCWDQSQNTIIVKGTSGWRGGTKPFGHMGRTAGFLAITTADTTVVMDAAQILRGGMTFDNANDALVLPIAGYYRVTAQLYATGGTAYSCAGRVWKLGTGGLGPIARFWKADSADYIGSFSGVMQFAAGDKITLAMTGGSSTWGTDGFNGTYLEAEYMDQW